MSVEPSSFLRDFLNSLPAAAISPLALVAYLGTLITWAYVSTSEKKLQLVLQNIQSFPEDQRRATVTEVLKAEIPANLKAAQYVQILKDRNRLLGFLAVCCSIVIILAMASWKAYDSRERADNLIKEILESATSDYRSAVNVLGNGAIMIREAAAEVRHISNDEMRTIVDRLALQRMNAEQIAKRLGELSGAGRLRRANNSLDNAARRVNEAYKKLTDCFRAVECRTSAETPRMCQAINGIISNIDAANAQALKIKGITFNETGAGAIFGNGTMDLYFTKITVPNLSYLASAVCGQK